ncbi:MAG: hypothetical protein EXR58_04525 [Chloroflexi bacterium]|nr:hypothetical protein [Chloroflexota bacterium]
MTEKPDADQISDFTPERWEIAIEDAAEVVALLLDRGQALVDSLADLRRTRPLLLAAAGAVAGGALIGAVVAGRRLRRRGAHASGALAQASAVAQAAAERIAEQQLLAMRSIKEGSAKLDGFASRQPSRLVEGGKAARQLLQVLPVVVTVLKNPLVRHLLWRYALKTVRR